MAKEYVGGHKAPVGGGVSAPLYDVTPIYPDDIYGPHAAQYYGHWGDSRRDREAIKVIQAYRGRPDATLLVYRAMPPEFEPEINPGDWVTTVRAYAVDHGESRLEGDYQIASRRVHARDLFTDGNSIFEFGYDPQPEIRDNPFEDPEPPDELYDPKALAAGIKVEMEHTTDRRIAKRIAKDHLDEDPEYYVKLKTLGLNPGTRMIRFSELDPETQDDVVSAVGYLLGEEEDEVRIGFDNAEVLLPFREIRPEDADAGGRAVSSHAVGKYAQAMRSGAVFPPVIIADGKLIEGGHRHAAAKRLGIGLTAIDLTGIHVVRQADGLETYSVARD